jgi:hypothetical protein
MPFRQFQVMLDAGMRWGVREQQQAIAASAYPHMTEEAQRDMHSALQDALSRAEAPVDDNTDTLQILRNMAQMKALIAKAGGQRP